MFVTCKKECKKWMSRLVRWHGIAGCITMNIYCI